MVSPFCNYAPITSWGRLRKAGRSSKILSCMKPVKICPCHERSNKNGFELSGKKKVTQSALNRKNRCRRMGFLRGKRKGCQKTAICLIGLRFCLRGVKTYMGLDMRIILEKQSSVQHGGGECLKYESISKCNAMATSEALGWEEKVFSKKIVTRVGWWRLQNCSKCRVAIQQCGSSS